MGGQFFVWNQTAQTIASFRTEVAESSFYIPFSAITGAANHANLRLLPEPSVAVALLVGCLMLGLLAILRKREIAAGE
jgi:hypothetical protein